MCGAMAPVAGEASVLKETATPVGSKVY
jgi:hypothetical protein